MFTGIIEELGVVEKVERATRPASFTIKAAKICGGLRKGDSVSVNGVCLTVIDTGRDRFSVEVVEETFARTNLGDLRRFDRVNLESALKVGDRLSGHFVSGHIDGAGTIVRKQQEEGALLIEFKVAEGMSNGIVEKGSIAIDGISLTVAVFNSSSLSVYVIPHTANVTTLGFKKPGDKVNLELDMLGKYVHKFLSHNKPTVITEEFLREKGFII